MRGAMSEMDGQSAAFYQELGDALRKEMRLEEAIVAFDRGVQLEPENWLLRFNLGWTLLLHGDFARGWDEFEYRQRTKDGAKPKDVGRPQWRGEELNGRGIILHYEGGSGDTIQFARYAPMVGKRGGKVMLVVQPGLVRLLRQLPGVNILTRDDLLPKFDFHCSVVSLPLAFGTDLNSIPREVPYLFADEGLAGAWGKRMAGSGLKVGLVWAGSATYKLDHERSISLAKLAGLGKIPGVTLFSLQRGKGSEEKPPEGMTMVDFSEEMSDFAETAGMVANLDLVITVDTAVAHLAGAMGKAVWVMLPFAPDWRWLAGRGDSPWYPTMRLFRQKSAGDWEPVIEEVVGPLRELARHG
jgi:hypothetical protein